MQKKSKHSDPKENDLPAKPHLTNNENKPEVIIKVKQKAPKAKMPYLLPRCNGFTKKGKRTCDNFPGLSHQVKDSNSCYHYFTVN